MPSDICVTYLNSFMNQQNHLNIHISNRKVLAEDKFVTKETNFTNKLGPNHVCVTISRGRDIMHSIPHVNQLLSRAKSICKIRSFQNFERTCIRFCWEYTSANIGQQNFKESCSQRFLRFSFHILSPLKNALCLKVVVYLL